MSALKWPIYTMAVDDTFVIARPKRSIRYNLHQRAKRRGIRLTITRVRKFDQDSPVVVKRIA